MKLPKKAIRYATVGLASFLIDFGATWLFVQFLPLLVANTFGFATANIANFVMAHRWVFGYPWERKRLVTMYLSVLGVSVVGMLINNLVVWWLAGVIGTSLLLAKIAASAIGMGWNFLARVSWIYNKSSH